MIKDMFERLREDMRIVDIKNDMAKLPEMYVDYLKLWYDALIHENEQELRFLNYESFLKKRIIEQFMAKGERMPSDNKLTSYLYDDPTYIELLSNYKNAKVASMVVKQALRVIETKKDMLVNLSASERVDKEIMHDINNEFSESDI